MALKLKKQLTSNGVKLDATFQPVIYVNVMLDKRMNNTPMLSYTVYSDINSTTPLMVQIDEIQNLRDITIPSDASGADLLTKFIKGLNDAVKAKLLELNPSWVSADVEIVNL